MPCERAATRWPASCSVITRASTPIAPRMGADAAANPPAAARLAPTPPEEDEAEEAADVTEATEAAVAASEEVGTYNTAGGRVKAGGRGRGRGRGEAMWSARGRRGEEV